MGNKGWDSYERRTNIYAGRGTKRRGSLTAPITSQQEDMGKDRRQWKWSQETIGSQE